MLDETPFRGTPELMGWSRRDNEGISRVNEPLEEEGLRFDFVDGPG